MRVTGRGAARAVFDQHTLDALARNIRQLVLIDERHLGVLRRICEDAAKRQRGDKQRTEDAFHGGPILGSAGAAALFGCLALAFPESSMMNEDDWLPSGSRRRV